MLIQCRLERASGVARARARDLVWRPFGNDEAAALAAYYGQMTGTPVWASTNGLTDKGKAVVSEISRAENWGLPASAFELPSAAAGTQPAEAAE